MLINLIDNIAFLIALVAAGQLVVTRFHRSPLKYPLVLGVLFGCVTLLGMMHPVPFAPGVIFDGRSIVLAVAGVVGGGLTAAIAASMAALYRYQLGGIGAPVGITVILLAALLGVLARQWWQRRSGPPHYGFYLALGVVVQLMQLAAFTQVPDQAGYAFIEQAWWILLLFYPLATMLLCLIFRNYEQQVEKGGALQAAQEAVIAEERASINRFHAYFDHSIVGLAITSLEKGWIEVNDALCQTLGYPQDELTRMTWTELTYPEDLPPDLAQFNRMLAGEINSYAMDKRFVHKDGHLVYTRLAVSHVRKPDGSLDYVVAMVEDISERKQTEQALLLERDNVRNILATVEAMIISLDREGRITLANRKACEILGYREDELIGQDWFATCLPRSIDVEQVREVFKQTLAGNLAGSEYYENPVRTRSGEERLIAWHNSSIRDKDGNIIAGLSAGEDITERKQHERELQQREQYQRALLDNFPFAVWLKDTESRFLAVNQGFVQLFGQSNADELIGKNDFDIAPAELAEGYRTDDRAVLASGNKKSVEEEIIDADGTRKWFETYKAPVFDDSGSVVGTVGFARDITERRATTQALQDMSDALTISRDLLQQIIDTAPIRVFWKDREGRYLGCNPLFARDAGKQSPAELIGQSDFAMGWAAQAELYRADDQEVMKSGQARINFEEQQTTPQGNIIWLRTSKTPLHDAQGKVVGVLGLYDDITERKQTEAALQHRQDMLTRTEGIAHIGSWEWDVETDTTKWSDELFRIFQRDPAEGAPSFAEHPALYISEDMECLKDAVTAALNQATPYELELRAIRRDGLTRVCLARGHVEMDADKRVTHLFGSLQDITERKHADQAILESGQRYQAVLSSTKDGFWVVDLNGQILEVNESYCRQSGYNREELLEMQVSQLDMHDDPEVVKTRIRQVVLEGGAIFESQHQRKDGSIWPVEASLSFASLQGGRLFCFFRDITERKAAEQLGNLRQQLADMVYSEDQKKLLQIALDTAEELTQSQIGFFHFVEKDQETVSLQTWSTRTLKEMCYAKGEGLHYPVSEAGVWVDCILQRKPVIHNDYAMLPHKKGMPEGHPPLSRELTVPVFRDNQIVAVLGVGNKPQDYDDNDVTLVSLMADMAFDFVERKQAEQQIQFMAFNDVLTGLPNRQLFADRLQQAIALAKRSNKLLAICYLDLDGFKPVNDRHGHESGDQLLVQLAHRLQQELREGDTLARLGGDEFVILLNELSSIFNGEEIVQRLLKVIAQPYDVGGHRIHISASLGVTVFPQDESDPDTLLRHADQAMYKAKQDGKNTFRLYDPIQDQKAQAFRKILTEFEEALHQSQLVLHYQPRIDLRSGDLAGVEALVRWQHPERGLLYPDQFLSMIEGNPLEIGLDEWVLKTALDQHVSWRDQGLTVPVSVNITPQHIQQTAFPEFLANLLSTYPEDLSRYLELEVLETSAIGDTAHVAEIMNACASLGVEFSLDDFGTGYSSLTYFHRLPISVLKIDQHFVRDMMNDPRDQDIVEGVLQLAKALNRPVVAEGVESVELGLMLVTLGCQYAQGYGISRPMPAEALPAWSRQWQVEDIWHQLHLEAHASTARYDLSVAIFTHRHWVKRVQHYLKTGLMEDRPDLDPTTCQFSHWYHGIGAARYGQQPSYPFILAKHDEVHRLAEELIKVAEDQGPDEAQTRMNELSNLCEALIAELSRLSEG